MSPNELIWIEDAVKKYKRSREWLQGQINDSKLTAFEIPGDRRVYLSIKEIEELLQPRPRGA